MAQNDTHVVLIILTTQMWGGGNYWWKKLFRAKFCVPVPLAPTSVLTQKKGPDTEPHFSNPPPPFLRRASMSPPPRRAIFRLPCSYVHKSVTSQTRLALMIYLSRNSISPYCSLGSYVPLFVMWQYCPQTLQSGTQLSHSVAGLRQGRAGARGASKVRCGSTTLLQPRLPSLLSQSGQYYSALWACHVLLHDLPGGGRALSGVVLLSSSALPQSPGLSRLGLVQGRGG